MSAKLPGSKRTLTEAATRPAGDLEFVRRVRDGERAAVDRFVLRMRCVPRMLARQNARLGAPLDDGAVEDLVQDVLVVIWRKLDDFEARATLETWAYRICRLELWNAVRRARRNPQPLGDSEGVCGGTADPDRRGGDAEAALRGLERLGPPAADVIRLKHFEQLTFEEIAVRLGMPANSAKTLYYRGLARLRDLMVGTRVTGAAS